MTNNKVPALVIGTVSLTAVPQVIEKQFIGFDKRLILPNSLRDFEVINEESCNIANLKLKEIIALYNEIDLVRVGLREPIRYIGDHVQAEAKKRFTDLDISKDILTKKITDYKNLETARLKMEEEKKKKEIEKDLDRKKKILERISSITLQLRSLLVGGEVLLSSGEKKLVAPPSTPDEVEKMKSNVTKSFPDFTSFQEYRNQIAEIYEKFVKDTDRMKMFLTTGDFDSIRDLRKEYNMLCNITEEKTTSVIEKEEKKAEKEIDQEIKDASKGVRSTLQFFVVNSMEVPETFKTVNPVLVNAYMRENKDAVVAAIKRGEGDKIIPGLDFKIDSKYVTR